MEKVKIGTCGFRGNKFVYAETLSAVEIQHTFYQPPQIKTLESWRAGMPDNFEFALKAWQLITHEATSPTYRRLKRKLSDVESRAAGSFKSTEIVFQAWETTIACADALKAQTILFQCPASFEQTVENVENLEKFFTTIERGALTFAWEPRGDWNPQIVKSICADLDLRHAVDPFKTQTVTPDKVYFRLHGRTGWRYKYEENELEELAAMLPANETAYVFFNNIYMTEDAALFQKIIADANAVQ